MSSRETAFTYRSARSGSLVLGLAMALAVETIALHALFMRSHPLVAWLLTATSVYALWWISADYRAMGRGAILVGDSTADIRVGRRVHVVVPLSEIAGVAQPTWRERPRAAPDYLNATKPAEPNVVIALNHPVPARLVGRIQRDIVRIGLRVDDPTGLAQRLAAGQGLARDRPPPPPTK